MRTSRSATRPLSVATADAPGEQRHLAGVPGDGLGGPPDAREQSDDGAAGQGLHGAVFRGGRAARHTNAYSTTLPAACPRRAACGRYRPVSMPTERRKNRAARARHPPARAGVPGGRQHLGGDHHHRRRLAGRRLLLPQPTRPSSARCCSCRLPLPKRLRQYDLNDASYRVYSLVRGVRRRADQPRVGVMFFGKFPPRGFHERPAARYLLPPTRSSNAPAPQGLRAGETPFAGTPAATDAAGPAADAARPPESPVARHPGRGAVRRIAPPAERAPPGRLGRRLHAARR